VKLDTPSQKAYDKIIALAGGEKSSHLEQYAAARKYLLDLREKGEELSKLNPSSTEMRDNRQEEKVVTRLVAYFKFEFETSAELHNRRQELERYIPGISGVLAPSENNNETPDERFVVA
jgi:hypothetical protein